MPGGSFDPFRTELEALRTIIAGWASKTIRDDDLRDRFRTLFRTWNSIVRPQVEPLLKTRRSLLKLGGELEAIAQLASKFAKVVDYRKRLGRAAKLADGLAIYIPVAEMPAIPPRANPGDELFIPSIPDLPVRFVPSSVFGWRSRMSQFVEAHPFDRSVFIMIRYRERNDSVIGELRSILSEQGYYAVLASDHRLTDDLYNPTACLLCCSRGVAVFDEAEVKQTFNPNVAYELGMLHLLGRDCLIVKHRKLKTLHTDILMKLYHEYDTPADIREQTRKWLEGD